MKQTRCADALALAVTAFTLACSPNPPTEATPTHVTQLPLGEASWYITGRSSADVGETSYTLLPDATVLIFSDVAETYDPATGLFTPVELPFNPTFGYSHRAVLLQNGKVALFGLNGQGDAVAFFDPADRSFSVVASCPFRCGSGEALLLPDGNVLLAGTEGICGGRNCFLVFDVATRTFGSTTWIDSTDFSLTLLPNGKVLHAQRANLAGDPLPAELLEPATGQFEETGFMLHSCPGPHALLPDGRVLFCCGGDPGTSDPPNDPPPPCEYYDPEAGAFVEGPSRAESHFYGAMVALPSGDVLLVNGWSPNFGDTATTELLERGASDFGRGPSTAIPRGEPKALVLPSGKLLVAGGNGGRQDGSLSPIEIYDPGIAMKSVTQVSGETVGRATAALPDGRVLLCGNDPASVYDPVADTLRTLNLHCGGTKNEVPSGTTTLLPDGRLLVVDGSLGPHAEIIDPNSDTVERIPGTSRQRHTATVLSSGAVLVSGGMVDDQGQPAFTTSAEVFEPDQNRFFALPDMKTSGGLSALLGTGKVLIVTSEQLSSGPPSAELFNPAEPASVLLGETPPALRFAQAIATLPSGDALIGASGGGWALFSAKNETLELIDALELNAESGMEGPGAALLTGDRLFCGYQNCARFEQVTGRFVESFRHGISVSYPYGVVASATGIVVVSEVFQDIQPNVGVAAIMRLWPFPPDAVRPLLDSVPERLVSGLPVTLTGSRFTRPSAVGANAMAPLDRHPLVAFMPVSGGGPVFSRVTKWTDTALTWIAPTTTFRGAGWVHVYVDGVPSVGRFTFLDAAARGVRCSSASVCGSGYCSEGVCCNRPCNGGCESCLAENQGPGGADGTCANVREGVNPKQICTDSLCGESGRCDGQGDCVVSGEAQSCSPYLCQDSDCLTTCNDGSDCAAGYSCTTGACGRCSSDGEGIERGSRIFSCAPYRCDRGQCETACDSRDDCAPNHRCDQGECVPSAEFEQAVDPGACSATRPGSRSSSLPWLLPLLGWLVRRRGSIGRLQGTAT